MTELIEKVKKQRTSLQSTFSDVRGIFIANMFALISDDRVTFEDLSTWHEASSSDTVEALVPLTLIQLYSLVWKLDQKFQGKDNDTLLNLFILHKSFSLGEREASNFA